MKILWISNVTFPEATSLITGEASLKSSGGWMIGAAFELIKNPEIDLYVASVSTLVKTLTFLKGDKIHYILLPLGKGFEKESTDYEKYWIRVKERIMPDIVHIHGTEYSHGLAYIRACSSQNVVVSIQGLTSVYSRYATSGLSLFEICRNITLYDIVKCGILRNQRKLSKRGLYEIKTLSAVSHIIGRTDWDKSHAWAINSNASYYHCDETLREEFYDGKWTYDKCIPHSIFVSQAGNPIKGLHQLLKAMPLVQREFPDTKIVIAGSNVLSDTNIKDRLFRTGYGKILLMLISKYKLEKCISFTGPLNAEEMKSQYLICNVFVSPSTIENSPNSVGEAQILGTPLISSYVGGVSTMIPNSDCGLLYRFEEVEMLAKNICDIFRMSSNINNQSMIREATRRHDKKMNAEKLISIYKEIINLTIE